MNGTSVRLSDEQLRDLALVARVDDVSVSEVIRRAIAAHLERRRAEPEFQARLAERVAADRELARRFGVAR